MRHKSSNKQLLRKMGHHRSPGGWVPNEWNREGLRGGGGRKEAGKGRGKTWLGWSPAQTLPWMEKEAFTFPIKRSFHHQTVYCLQNHGQITYSCCSSGLLWTHSTSGVILSRVWPNVCFVAPRIFKMSTYLHPRILQILNICSKHGSNSAQTLRHQERKFVATLLQKAAKSVRGFFEGLRLLTPCLSLMLRYYASVTTQGTGLIKWAGIQRWGQFLQATGSNYAKAVMPYDEEESRARGWHLCRRRGYCYCCSQILLSPVRIWWMNHLAIGQACTTLSLQQKRHPPEGSRVCSKAALNTSTLTDKVVYLRFWKHLDLHLLLCAHRSHNKCKHTWVHLKFLPPASARKKWKQSCEASSRECKSAS